MSWMANPCVEGLNVEKAQSPGVKAESPNPHLNFKHWILTDQPSHFVHGHFRSDVGCYFFVRKSFTQASIESD